MLTKEEKKLLFEILDQLPVRGIEAKAKVLVIMGKLKDEEVPDIPDTDVDAAE
jgi:hypothetical protein